MNDHQQVAQYIMGKLDTCSIQGNEAQVLIQAQQWLALIAQGKFTIKEAKPELVEKMDEAIEDSMLSPGGTA